jgi:hypothetical protein
LKVMSLSIAAGDAVVVALVYSGCDRDRGAHARRGAVGVERAPFPVLESGVADESPAVSAVGIQRLLPHLRPRGVGALSVDGRQGAMRAARSELGSRVHRATGSAVIAARVSSTGASDDASVVDGNVDDRTDGHQLGVGRLCPGLSAVGLKDLF